MKLFILYLCCSIVFLSFQFHRSRLPSPIFRENLLQNMANLEFETIFITRYLICY